MITQQGGGGKMGGGGGGLFAEGGMSKVYDGKSGQERDL